MLLDEPTNNLDDESRQIVRDVLANWRRGAIVVSHDRALLRQMDCIVELSPLGARAYGGGYDFYVERRAEERAAAERTLATAQRDAHRIEREAQAARERQEKRSGAGARSRSKGDQPKILMDAKRDRSQRTAGAQADIAGRRRQSAAEAVEKAEAAIDQFTGIGFRLPPTGLPAGRTVLAFAGVGYRHPGMRPVLDRFDFAITGPERIALTGRNGSGKSTFLRLGAGYLDAQTGQIVRPVKAALLDQTVGVLDAGDTILANFRRLNQEATDNHAHAMLARFLFRSADARRAVGTLSGGEMLRAGLACTLGATTPPQLLMLDEPTNHLDLDSIAAIEQALRDFDGALIIASHDADFLASVGVTRRLSFPLFPE
jgi:ATPase subunit of ABC transporter with duplicated ATPase domains